MAIDFCIGDLTNITNRGWCYVQGKAQMRIILDITYVIRDLLALLGEGKTNFKLFFQKTSLSKLLVKANFCHSEFWYTCNSYHLHSSVVSVLLLLRYLCELSLAG